jgi:5-methylcytosine-specific restriction protein A
MARPGHQQGQHQHLYGTQRWRRLSLAQLRREPLCSYCQAQGRITPATVADHVVPHSGDHHLFFGGKLQSLCKFHHDSAKKSEENRGYSTLLDLDGRPIDPKHPSY